MTIEIDEYLKKQDKRSRLRYVGLGLALVCGIAGAVLWVSDRTTPHLLTLVALWAVGAWAQHVTYKLADALYSGT
ncbi:hypothetical protein C8K18_10722 [Paraburkholderia sp. GV068]|nr:hypothetical protein C8K19_10722 [Paraburkholderia sp. GV072]PUB03683.1 hypothetical protein C8K18_10722 [Paraburkholderia sp. GV068]